MPDSARRCDQCAHVEHLRGVHPMRCTHPILRGSLPCGVMRASTGACGLSATLWQAKTGDPHADHA